MDLTAINQAIDTAYNEAISNGGQLVIPHNIATNVTLQTDTYVAPDGKGFRVVCCVKIPEINFSICRVRNHGPDTGSEIEWPEEGIEAAGQKHVANCIRAGEAFVEAQGFTADRKVILLNKLLKVKENFSAANHPKLIALYIWMENVQQHAIAGLSNFQLSPYTFEEVIME